MLTIFVLATIKMIIKGSSSNLLSVYRHHRNHIEFVHIVLKWERYIQVYLVSVRICLIVSSFLRWSVMKILFMFLLRIKPFSTFGNQTSLA